MIVPFKCVVTLGNVWSSGVDESTFFVSYSPKSPVFPFLSIMSHTFGLGLHTPGT